MSEIVRNPVKITVGDTEYAAFDEDHTWNDVARWAVGQSATDAEALAESLQSVLAIADTRPKDGDAFAAPLASGGGAKQSPEPLPLNHHRR